MPISLPQQLPSVSDSKNARHLILGNQVQGGSALVPSASVVEPALSGPGPVSIADYQNGWLSGGLPNPGANALMIGLGAGSGVVSLLYNFPQLRMTVVEISEDVVRAAIDGFPLLGYYLAEGRLELEIQDATTYLPAGGFDLGFADAYVGENQLVMPYLEDFLDSCQRVWLNVIDRPQGQDLRKVAAALQRRDRDVRIAGVQTWQGMKNWLMTDQVDFPEFQPYAELDGPEVQQARSVFHRVQAELV